jgi:8-amino-7-oxononanoate synthase
MSNVNKRLLKEVEKRRENGNFRALALKNGLVDFSSNDYLGLSNNERLLSNIQEQYNNSGEGIGSTGSRLLSGNSSLHQALEFALARFFEGPEALLFNSGYTANLALISAIAQRGDTILYDQKIHACIKEGARLSKGKYYSFRHNDPKDLQRKLKNSTGNKFVVIESLYSMEGDFPPVLDIIELCRQHKAELLIDEAHTTGWLGSQGKGWVIEQKLARHFLARVYTFGKALGAYGACVVGSKELINYLINFSRPFIYTTALPPHTVVSINCALGFIEEQDMPGKILYERINHYLKVSKHLEIKGSYNEDSPIQWIKAIGNKQAISLSDHLAKNGYDVRPILSPTVPEGEERLRVCIHSFNSNQQITDLLTTIARL